MKTAIKLERLSKLILMATVFSVIFLVSACGKKDGGGKVATTPNSDDTVISGCSGCKTSNLLGKALGKSPTGTSPNGFELGLSFYATGATNTSHIGSGFYSGPVAAKGLLYTNGAQLIGCPNMPNGKWTVRTVQPGQWDGSTGIFYNLVLQATHTNGTKSKIYLADGAFVGVQPEHVGHYNHRYPYGMWATVVIEGIGSCHSNLTQLFLSYL